LQLGKNVNLTELQKNRYKSDFSLKCQCSVTLDVKQD